MGIGDGLLGNSSSLEIQRYFMIPYKSLFEMLGSNSILANHGR